MMHYLTCDLLVLSVMNTCLGLRTYDSGYGSLRAKVAIRWNCRDLGHSLCHGDSEMFEFALICFTVQFDPSDGISGLNTYLRYLTLPTLSFQTTLPYLSLPFLEFAFV